MRKMKVRKVKKFAFDHTVKENLENCKYSINASHYNSGEERKLEPKCIYQEYLKYKEFNIGNKVLIVIICNYYRGPENFRKVEKITQSFIAKSQSPLRQTEKDKHCTVPLIYKILK